MRVKIKYYEEQSKDQLKALFELALKWEEVNETRIVFSEGKVYRWYWL